MTILPKFLFLVLTFVSFQAGAQGIGIAEIDHSCTLERFSRGKAFIACDAGHFKIAPHDASREFCKDLLTKPFTDFFSGIAPSRRLVVTTVKVCESTPTGNCEQITKVNAILAEQGSYLNNATYVRVSDGRTGSCGIGYTFEER